MDAGRILDDPRFQAYGLTMAVYVNLERRIAQALQSNLDLPHSMYEILVRLSNAPQGRMPLTALAHDVLLTGGGVSRLVDRMAAVGFVARTRSAEDRRVFYVRITPKGERMADEATPVVARVLQDNFASSLEEEEVQEYLRLMGKVRTNMRASVSDPARTASQEAGSA